MSINYNELYEKILKNDEIPSVKKAALIRMLKYYASFKSEQDAKEREDKTYTVHNSKISDKDRINLELYKIEELYKNEENKENEIDKLINLKKTYSKMLNIKDPDTYQKIKEDLTEIQIENEINPKFYSAYDNIIKKYTSDDENKKTF